MRPNIEEIRKDWNIDDSRLPVAERIVIDKLLNYIDELENTSKSNNDAEEGMDQWGW